MRAISCSSANHYQQTGSHVLALKATSTSTRKRWISSSLGHWYVRAGWAACLAESVRRAKDLISSLEVHLKLNDHPCAFTGELTFVTKRRRVEPWATYDKMDYGFTIRFIKRTTHRFTINGNNVVAPVRNQCLYPCRKSFRKSTGVKSGENSAKSIM